MPEHPPPHPRQGDMLAEEDPPDPGRDVGERVADAPDNDVLERRGAADEGRPVGGREEEALVEQSRGQFESCVIIRPKTLGLVARRAWNPNKKMPGSRRNGGGGGDSERTEEREDLYYDPGGLEYAHLE